MGGSSKQQTQSTSSAPWAPSQPALKYGVNEALKLTKNNVGGNVYQGSTVVPYSGATQAGMEQTYNNANIALPEMRQNFNQVAENASNGGLNALQQQQVGRLQSQADGSMLFNNPNVQKMIDMNARDIGAASNLMASAAGRYGSGSHQNVTQRNVGDMATQVRADDYGKERGYMQDAIGSLFNAGQQQQDNINGNSAALMGAYGAMNAPTQTKMDIGGMQEDLWTRQKNDEIRRWEGRDNGEWNRLGLLNAIASGAGQMGTNGQTTAQGPNNTMSNMAGGGLGLLSLLGGAGLFG